MLFTHTYLERRMWRGWFKNGQSLEITWPRSSIGVRVLIHSNDRDEGDRMLNVALGFGQAFIPLGIVRDRLYTVGNEPSWGIDISREFGISLSWGQRRRTWKWPFRIRTLEWDYELADGTLEPVRGSEYPRQERAKVEVHPYRYTLQSGEVQERLATIYRERWVRGRNILHRLGWPKRRKFSIDVEFNDEVGERSGSWKGGTIGCGYDMRSGETPLDTLRRMERERKF